MLTSAFNIPAIATSSRIVCVIGLVAKWTVCFVGGNFMGHNLGYDATKMTALVLCTSVAIVLMII